MGSPPHHVVVLPFDLGEASRFNRAIFPLSYRKRDGLSRGDLYLDATLDEMLKITNIGANPEECNAILVTTKARYDRLILKKMELEKRPKTWNPFKVLANYRAARVFLAASKSLYFATRTRSEEVRRTIGRGLLSVRAEDANNDPSPDTSRSRSEEVMRAMGSGLLSVPAEDMESVDSDPPPGTNIKAIAVRLDRPLDDATRQQLIDVASTIVSYPGPYEDDQSISEASSFLSDEYFLASESLSSLVRGTTEESENTPDTTNIPTPSSPTVIHNYNYTFYGSVFSPNSNVHAPTVQIGGSENSGSVTHTITPPNLTHNSP